MTAYLTHVRTVVPAQMAFSPLPARVPRATVALPVELVRIIIYLENFVEMYIASSQIMIGLNVSFPKIMI